MNIAQSKLLEIEARLRSLAAAILGVLPEQSGNSGKFLKTDGTAASWDTPVGGSGGNAVYVQEGGAAEADSSAAALTVNFADADFDVTTVGQTSSVAINDGGIAHSGLAGTHNLTTDIDHGSIGGLADDDHLQYHTDARGDARYALIAAGVTNGNSHDHAGGDGAQVDHGGLGGLGDDDHTQYVLKSTYDAHTVLAATSDNTPAALTVGEQTVVGRITGGNIAALTPAQLRTMLGVSAKSKTAATTRNNTDVYAADPHLVSFALEASSYYEFVGKVTVSDGGSADYKLRLVGNQNYTGSATAQLGTVNAKDIDVTAGTTMDFGQINVTSGAAITHYSGWIYTNTAVSIDVQWAQFVATVADTTLHQGSCFVFTKIQ